MDDICTCRIELQGQLDQNDLSHISPLSLTRFRQGSASTRFTVRTDQSGLIGLIRCLHGRGLVLRSVKVRRTLDTKGN
jgi:hypothetical protein